MAKIKPIHITDEFDPERCQGNLKFGQCHFKAIPGSQYCPIHNSGAGRAEKKETLRNYRLTKWQARLEELSDSEKRKDLSEEIGIIRILVEEKMNLCETAHDIMAHSGGIADLVSKLERIVMSAQKLDERNNELLDKSTVAKIAEGIIDIIMTYIEDEEIVENIADGISDLFDDTYKTAKQDRILKSLED